MPATIQVFRTTLNTKDRLTEKAPITFQIQMSDLPTVYVDSQHRFQTVEGFGGSFTEAADTFFKMLPEMQEEILRLILTQPPAIAIPSAAPTSIVVISRLSTTPTRKCQAMWN